MRVTALLFCLLLLTACGRGPQHFSFDNPTAQPLAIQVDGKAQTIPAHAALELELKPGAHSLETKQLGHLNFMVYTGHDGAVVNPTLSDYVLVSEDYADDSTEPKVISGEGKVQIEGVEVTGRFSQTHDLFINKDWDFDVHTPFPDTVSEADGSGARRMTKIFAADDFVTYYEWLNQAPGYFAARRPADWQPPVRKLPPEVSALPTLAPALEPHTKDMRALISNYLHATDPSEQKRLAQSYVATQIAFTQATASLYSGLSVAETTQINNFVTGASHIMTSAAVVIPD